MMAPACPCPALQVRATATVVDPKKTKAEQEKAEAERIRVRPGEAAPPALWARFYNARSRWLGALDCAGMDTCLLVCPLLHLWMRALFLLLSPLCTCSSDIDLLPLLVRQAREKLEERQAKTMRKFSVPRWRSSAPQTLNAGVTGGAGGEEAVMELQAVRCLVPGSRGGQGCTLHTPNAIRRRESALGKAHLAPLCMPWHAPDLLPTSNLAPAGYLEEDEDVEEEGLAEDMREAQRQRMLGGRGRCACLCSQKGLRSAPCAACVQCC